MPAEAGISNIIEKVTGHPTGNAGLETKVEVDCRDASDKKTCEETWIPTTQEKIRIVITSPITEEIVFRGLPSFVLSAYEYLENAKKTHEPESMRELFLGSRAKGLGLSRRELLVGILTSLTFGIVHNFTEKGFDTHTIPIVQTIGGFKYWWLQRKFGILANTTGHIVDNFLATVGPFRPF